MKIIFTILMLLLFVSNSSYCQTDSRIGEIRNLYKEFNSDLKEYPEYEFHYYSEGDETRVKMSTDLSGRIILKTTLTGEFSYLVNEFYFKNDTIQFVFSEYMQTNHWMEDTVKYTVSQNRYYFENSKIIKCLTKDIKGFGTDNRKDLAKKANIEKSIRPDFWADRLNSITELYMNLEKVIRTTKKGIF